MPDLPTHSDTGQDTNLGDDSPFEATPRWKKILYISIGVAVLAAFLILHLTGVLGPDTHK